MIKSSNQLVTERCNSRCEMCSVWKLRDKSYEMTPREFAELYEHNEFRELEDLCISGGEPTLRKDLFEVVDEIRMRTPLLRMLFLSTNGTNPEKALDFMKRYSPHVQDIYVCPSLEGPREVHNEIRGVDCYDKVIETAEIVQKASLPNAHVVFSTTLQPENCNEDSLNHIKGLAMEIGCTYSFRPASRNESFYHNLGNDSFLVGPKGIEFIKQYMERHKISDPFLDILLAHLSGDTTFMGDREEGINCLAGKISVFIKPNGDIYPCINSTRIIGNREDGITERDYQLGDKELCPCCTECQVYPMLNFGQHAHEGPENE